MQEPLQVTLGDVQAEGVLLVEDPCALGDGLLRKEGLVRAQAASWKQSFSVRERLPQRDDFLAATAPLSAETLSRFGTMASAV